MSDAMQGVMPAAPMPPVNGADIAMAPQPLDASATLDGAASPSAPPEPPEVVATETLYIQNLNERIKVDGNSVSLHEIKCLLILPLQVMKQTLRALFKNYGEVLDVVAHSNLRMRGQAFVSFASADTAKKAQKEVNRFPLYTKPMVFIQL